MIDYKMNNKTRRNEINYNGYLIRPLYEGYLLSRENLEDIFKTGNGKKRVLFYMSPKDLEASPTDNREMYMAAGLSLFPEKFIVGISPVNGHYDSSIAKHADVIFNRLSSPEKERFYAENLGKYDDGRRLFVNDDEVRRIKSRNDFLDLAYRLENSNLRLNERVA